MIYKYVNKYLRWIPIEGTLRTGASGSSGGGGSDDDDKEEAIPFGNYYLLFLAVGVISFSLPALPFSLILKTIYFFLKENQSLAK